MRILKKEQHDRKDRDGVLYLHPDYVYMARGMQCAEIIDFGKNVAKVFPTVKAGDMVLMHHFVEGKQNENADDGRYFLYSDDIYNYYTVTVQSHRGRQNETYGIYDGDTIIPHPEYLFLSTEKLEVNISSEDNFIVSRYHETRAEKGTRMKEIQNHIKELTKSTLSTELNREIERKEAEMNAISKDVNSRFYDKYIIKRASHEVAKWFGRDSINHSIGYILNIACNTKISFDDKEYIVAKAKYMSAINE